MCGAPQISSPQVLKCRILIRTQIKQRNAAAGEPASEHEIYSGNPTPHLPVGFAAQVAESICISIPEHLLAGRAGSNSLVRNWVKALSREMYE